MKGTILGYNLLLLLIKGAKTYIFSFCHFNQIIIDTRNWIKNPFAVIACPLEITNGEGLMLHSKRLDVEPT